MPAGTIALTNGSTTVTGTGTSFTTELKAGDFVYVMVGGAPYTMVASVVTSNTQLTLAVAFDGPTTSGLAWVAAPALMLSAITQKMLNDFANVARGRILDFQNWQKIYSSDQSVTVTRPDRTTFTGPSWGYMSAQFAGKANTADVLTKAGNLDSLANKATSRSNLGLGNSATRDVDVQLPTIGSGGVMIQASRDYRPLVGYDTISNYPLGMTAGIQDAAKSWNTSGDFVGLLTVRSWTDTTAGGNAAWQLAMTATGFKYRQGNASTAGGTNNIFGATQTIYSTQNTTKASDGTLKAASPVARIVCSKDDTQRTDVAEAGFTWCGCGTANEEAEGISLSRMAAGVYVLAGSAGLANEGWQLLPPRDPQGSGDLGIVEAEQTESGGLKICLYKRRYRLNDNGDIEVIKGDLIDVPANSWIDVRLDMPEDSAYNLRQPKVKISTLEDETQKVT